MYSLLSFLNISYTEKPPENRFRTAPSLPCLLIPYNPHYSMWSGAIFKQECCMLLLQHTNNWYSCCNVRAELSKFCTTTDTKQNCFRDFTHLPLFSKQILKPRPRLSPLVEPVSLHLAQLGHSKRKKTITVLFSAAGCPEILHFTFNYSFLDWYVDILIGIW